MRRLIPLLVVLVTAYGCSAPSEDVPPKIKYGRDVCAECRMIVQDQRFAAAVSGGDGLLKFDDIGCLWRHPNGKKAASAEVWVCDADGGGWFKADEGYFVKAEDLVTPMGYGIAAFKSAERAQQFADENKGRVIRAETEAARPAERSTTEERS